MISSGMSDAGKWILRPPLGYPVTVLVGDSDLQASTYDAAAWRNILLATSSSASFRVATFAVNMSGGCDRHDAHRPAGISASGHKG